MTETDPTRTSLDTAPLLAEDVLVLLFDPESGTIRSEGTPLLHTLAGAVITELALDGAVTIDEHGSGLRGRLVHAVEGHEPADPLLATTWQRLADKPTDLRSLLLEIGPRLRGPVIDRVVERGALRRENRKTLGFIPTTALMDGGTGRRDELLDLVRPVLLDDQEPSPRSGALAALLSASGALPALHRDLPWSGALYTRGQQLQRGEWGAAATGEAVAASAAAVAAAVLSNSLFVSVVLPSLRD
ncbi:GPP34 family phosphoprotein [uncultured Frigoribacterium sp.]|uniref:GOLPH3/VPS74 family protein n=1 Tax=uncultured Frigoribacterium sp. TaxID=335377 RepID=UPI0028D85A06|nr:GPP34 family phosphoprotein [uncultured Frigoribacterium sp.]